MKAEDKIKHLLKIKIDMQDADRKLIKLFEQKHKLDTEKRKLGQTIGEASNRFDQLKEEYINYDLT